MNTTQPTTASPNKIPDRLKLPIIYVRGYAGTQSEVEQTVDDPFYGFNVGSTHVRLDEQGRADFYIFESPFVRLLTDHGYLDVFDGAMQSASKCPTKQQTIWIYRYYDPTTKTYDRPGGRRLSIEEAADGLRVLIDDVLQQTGAPKVWLVAHSMGGLVCRCLIQKIYRDRQKADPDRNKHASEYVDKLFTYGTPHGGINFELGFGIIEKLRDAFGVNQSADFGRQRMYEYLTPAAELKAEPMVPDTFRQDFMPPEAFDVNRVFCIVGTNARDYEAAMGLSRSLVGPQSDGLVQMDSAAVSGSHRAHIHRSHSGRYGMVNSDEAYQNLQRFLLGDVRVKMVLCDFTLDYTDEDDDVEVTYQFELQVALKGLPISMHERSIRHYSPVSLSQAEYDRQVKRGLPLYTNFLMAGRDNDQAITYMLRIGVYKQRYRRGIFLFGDHIEHLPLWSDYLVVTATPSFSSSGPYYEAVYSWASQTTTPDRQMPIEDRGERVDAIVHVPERAHRVLGSNAIVRFETTDWV